MLALFFCTRLRSNEARAALSPKYSISTLCRHVRQSACSNSTIHEIVGAPCEAHDERTRCKTPDERALLRVAWQCKGKKEKSIELHRERRHTQRNSLWHTYKVVGTSHAVYSDKNTTDLLALSLSLNCIVNCCPPQLDSFVGVNQATTSVF